MPCDPHNEILIVLVQTGPETAMNRFCQVPQASGITNANPNWQDAVRSTKAEGGWGVICTGAHPEYPSSDDSPFPFASLWDVADVRSHALMSEAVHCEGVLAGIEFGSQSGQFTIGRNFSFAPDDPLRSMATE